MSEDNSDKNLGHLLVVTTASKFSKNEIKRLIKSKSFIQIKTTRRNPNKEIAAFIRTVAIALDCSHFDGEVEKAINVYKVDNAAVSTLYAIADPEFIGAIHLTSQQYAELTACVSIIAGIFSIWETLDCLQADFDCIGSQAGLGMIDIEALKTDFRQLDLLSNRLGESSFIDAIRTVQLLIKRKW